MSALQVLILSVIYFWSQIFGRAIKNEYLSLGTIIGTAAIAYASMSGGKKEAAPSGSTVQETIQKVKEAVPLGAGSRYVFRPDVYEHDWPRTVLQRRGAIVSYFHSLKLLESLWWRLTRFDSIKKFIADEEKKAAHH